MLTQATFGQRTIYGTVIDGNTREPLPFANVFVNSTTLGAVTNEDGKYRLMIPEGEYQIVFSFIGYKSTAIQTLPQSPATVKIDVELLQSTEELQSISIEAKADKRWAKQFQQFQDFFLGTSDGADYCTIRNAGCIDFNSVRVSGKQTLTAAPTQPLEIDNLALGYKIFYELHNFSASTQNVRFSGNVFFVELKPKDTVEGFRWQRNRLSAYQGSSRHLFESILAGRIREEGFGIFVYETSYNKMRRISYVPEVIFDSLNARYRIPVRENIVVDYETPSTPPTTLVSGLNAMNDTIEVDKNGVIIDPMSVIITGHMSKSRVADFLPNNYQPTAGPTGQRVSAQPVRDSPRYFRDSLTLNTLARFDSIEKKINYFLEGRISEKVYIHFDKPFYVLGEDSWYKAYVVRVTDLNATDISSVLYVDWIDPAGNIISHQRLRIENGAAIGGFSIGSDLPQGTYTVRAYTTWMRNEDPEFFFSREIEVLDPAVVTIQQRGDTSRAKIDLQFFPEGGTWVADIQSRLAFKAIDRYGRGVDVQGKIVDEENRIIIPFKSVHKGLGVLPLTPHHDKSYRAILENGEVVDLPTPLASGLTLAAAITNDGEVIVRIQSSEPEARYAYLVGQSRGAIHYTESLMMDGPLKDLHISADVFPDGILELTLFNDLGLPQCTRKLFIRRNDDIDVSVTSATETFGPRDSIAVTFNVTDADGNPIETSLSVAVTDASLTGFDPSLENIYTRLLLQSDIKGNVEDPGWYFESESVDKRYALDLVMLTHGWSRYNWQAILDDAPDGIAFAPEKGIDLSGRILANRKPVQNSPFVLMIPRGTNDFFNIYETDSLGRFRINGLDFSDSTVISWRVMKRKGVVQNAKVELSAEHEILAVTKSKTPYYVSHESKDAFYDRLITQFAETGVWRLDNSRVLKEVTIESRKLEIASVGINTIAVKPGPEDLSVGTMQFVSRYALKPPKAVSINGYLQEGDPALVLNAIPIESIEGILVAGTPRGGYSVAVWTRTSLPDGAIGTVKQTVKGYDVAREFYHPKYGPSDIPSSAPDNRMTLYWNPNIRTDKKGKATATFYNTDVTKQLLIVAEGLSNGFPISSAKVLGKSE